MSTIKFVVERCNADRPNRLESRWLVNFIVEDAAGLLLGSSRESAEWDSRDVVDTGVSPSVLEILAVVRRAVC